MTFDQSLTEMLMECQSSFNQCVDGVSMTIKGFDQNSTVAALSTCDLNVLQGLQSGGATQLSQVSTRVQDNLQAK